MLTTLFSGTSQKKDLRTMAQQQSGGGRFPWPLVALIAVAAIAFFAWQQMGSGDDAPADPAAIEEPAAP